MPVQLATLRNMTPNVVVLTPDPSDSKTYLTFEAAGDPTGGDYQYVTEDVAATSPVIVKAILHEILENVSPFSEDAKQSFEAQLEVARMQRRKASQAIQDSLQRGDERDMLGVTCIGPGTAPGTPCGAHVAMRVETVRTIPPLCARHTPLVREYVPTDHFDGEKHTTQWIRSTLGERKREGDPV